MLSPYRDVLTVPGAVRFSLAGVLARLPIAMAGLGIVLLVSDRTGSYATAGSVSAAYIAANAVAALPLARLIDRWGQGRVIPPAALLSGGGLVLLLVAVEAGLGTPWLHLCAALAGSAFPNVGAAVRARWSYVLTDRGRLDTAFALESVNDEVVFIVGPTLVTLLATTVHPLAGLASAVTMMLLGALWLGTQRDTEPPPHPKLPGERPPDALPWLGLGPLVVAGVLLGVMFGGCEVAVVAFAEESGSRAASGVVLAVWALGSLIAGVLAGALTFRTTPAQRFVRGTLALAVLMLPLPFVDGLVALGAFMFLAGTAIAPTMIAATSWIEQITPTSRLNEGMAAFGTALVAGVAPGAAVVGIVVDARGASAAFWVPAGAAVVGALLGLAISAVGRRRTPAPRTPESVVIPTADTAEEHR